MVLEVQERGRYLLKACTKCGGDLILGEEDLYCFQCGERVYGEVDYEVKKEASNTYALRSLEKGNRYLERRKAIVEMLESGSKDFYIAETLGISRRIVSQVREVLKDKEEG